MRIFAILYRRATADYSLIARDSNDPYDNWFEHSGPFDGSLAEDICRALNNDQKKMEADDRLR